MNDLRHNTIIFYLSLLIAIIAQSVSAHAYSEKFIRFSNSHVNNIYQDSKGYIWVCSDNGLNRFDGVNVKTFSHIHSDTTSLVSNSVLTIMEDRSGTLWVGTVAGIQSFDRKTERFSSPKLKYPHITDFTYVNTIIEDKKGNIWFTTSRSGIICLKAGTREPVYYLKTNSNICSNKINTLYEDRYGNIWIGSQESGISILNSGNHTLTNYEHDPENENSLSSNTVFSFAETPDGQMLVGTIDGGIDAFNYATRKFTRNYIPCDGNIFTLTASRSGRLWIGTDGNGLKYYDFKTHASGIYESRLQDFDYRRIKVHSIYEDKQGNLWAAIFQKGVLMIPPEDRRFNNIGFNPYSVENSIGSECVLSILQDRDGDLWVGTDGDGIYRLNNDKVVSRHYGILKGGGKSILSIFQDSRGDIWVGSYLYGLYKYERSSDSFRNVPIYDDFGRSIKEVNVINEDKNGNLWIGTNGNGLCIYDTKSGKPKFLRYNLMKDSGQLLGNSIHSICFDKRGNVWIGTSEAGISKLNLKTGKYTDYNTANGNLCSNNVFSIVEDRKGYIYAGTKMGITRINPSDGTAKFYTVNDGLSNDCVYGLEIDGNDNLWASTNEGLSKMNLKNGDISTYYVTDGIMSNEFKRGAAFKSASGELFFGGLDGLTSFRPFETRKIHPLLNLAFTDLYMQGSSDDNGVADSEMRQIPIDELDKITLPYDSNSFSIGYSAIEYNYPDNVEYQIRLETPGGDGDWITQPLKTRVATYTNLKPGKYVFHVRATLGDSGTVLERSITIIIKPPFWLSWWAKTIYALLILAVAFVAYRSAMNRLRARKRIAEQEGERRMMESKLQFFTDISHEVRTPLTLILSPIESLIKSTSNQDLLKIYKMIDQNGKRILRMINQIMDLRKLDNSEMRLAASETDVKQFLTTVFSSFTQMAEKKGIEYDFSAADNLPRMWIDRDKLDKVVFNVLSNAFKYTPDGGRIALSVAVEDDNLTIRVKDSGAGIPKEFWNAIFERFYQVRDDSNRNKMGTGIGLHLCHKLMELHHGRIFVESSDANGSVFTIQLPLDSSYLTDDQKVSETDIVQPQRLELPDEDDESAMETAEKEPSASKNRHTVLVVEDEAEIRNYLHEILGKEYNVITAENGAVGLEAAIKQIPDCIVTDIMMPEMTGTEMCRKIKTNPSTCDIPVIMLTAKATEQQRVEGIQYGADSYITKPFSVDHLKTRIRKLIELRYAMRSKYSGKLEVKDDNIKVKSADEKLLEKVEAFVLKQLDNTDLSVELISQEIGVSRSHLHRKLKQLTNQNPSDYIKNTRLRHAAYLLANKNIAVSEACYATGFSSLSHFSNSFKEFYGISPTKYVELNRVDTDNK